MGPRVVALLLGRQPRRVHAIEYGIEAVASRHRKHSLYSRNGRTIGAARRVRSPTRTSPCRAAGASGSRSTSPWIFSGGVPAVRDAASRRRCATPSGRARPDNNALIGRTPWEQLAGSRVRPKTTHSHGGTENRTRDVEASARSRQTGGRTEVHEQSHRHLRPEWGLANPAPSVPVTAKEMAAEATRGDAGASVLHLHFRNPTPARPPAHLGSGSSPESPTQSARPAPKSC